MQHKNTRRCTIKEEIKGVTRAKKEIKPRAGPASNLAGERSPSIFAGFGRSPTIAVSRELYLTPVATRNKHK